MAKKLKDKTIYPVWTCAVINGRVQIQDREAFDKHLAAFEGKENLELILKRKVKGRSRQVEKYYRAVVIRMVADAMSITDDEAHDFLKEMFLKTEESTVLPNGKNIRYTRIMSTTELGDKRYMEYVFDEILPWAIIPTGKDGLHKQSGLGLYIPSPNEADWDGRDEYFQDIHK